MMENENIEHRKFSKISFAKILDLCARKFMSKYYNINTEIKCKKKN